MGGDLRNKRDYTHYTRPFCEKGLRSVFRLQEGIQQPAWAGGLRFRGFRVKGLGGWSATHVEAFSKRQIGAIVNISRIIHGHGFLSGQIQGTVLNYHSDTDVHS